MIEIKGLKKSFGGNHVLKGVDIKIEDGETLAIIGASGCGKSVLLKNIIGLLQPDEGTVEVDGLLINTATHKQLQKLRANIGFLFQNAALFDSMTVEENITLGIRDHETRGIFYSQVGDSNPKPHTPAELKQLVKDKLSLVGLHGIESRKPAVLSGGMRKRVGLARALVMDPAYMFYDEPTTGLDPVLSDQIDRLIHQLTDQLKVTSIIVTHDMFTVERIAERVIFLFDGLVYFDGTPDDLKRSSDSAVKRFLERYYFINR
jgi:phospholipid/cholesterol/gamma-HCH transport system ATP-binding protein